MTPRLLVPLMLAPLAACGGPPPPPPAPPALAYGAEAAVSARYTLGDTARVEIDAGGETMEAGVAVGTGLDMEFRPAPGGLTVSATFRDASARASNPMMPARTARLDAAGEPLVFGLDRRGEPSLRSVPELPTELARFLSPAATAATLFPRLPGRAVEVGDRWTDTVQVDARDAGTRMTGTSVVTYTVLGDTIVGERSLVRVGVVGEDQREIRATEQGMEVRQSLSGASTGGFLWDLSRGLLHESVYDSELTGTMEVQEAPFPLSLRVRSRTDLRFVEDLAQGDER